MRRGYFNYNYLEIYAIDPVERELWNTDVLLS